jgi:hypothetical protein
MKKNQLNSLLIITSVIIFAFIYVFFTIAHPMIPWVGDDWACMGAMSRRALPTNETWNGGRVFPDVFAPMVGYFAAYIVYPILGDYLHSISVTSGVIISLFSIIFYIVLYKFFYALTFKNIVSLCISLIVVVVYFVLFQSKSSENIYMLWMVNLTTLFYYFLPNIINSTLVLYFMTKSANNENIIIENKNLNKTALLICILYFSLFSMMWGSVILFVYAVLDLLISFISIKLNKRYCKSFIKNKIFLLFIVVFFLIYIYFEFTSARGKSLLVASEKRLFFADIKLAMKEFFAIMTNVQHILRVFAFWIVCTTSYIVINYKETMKSNNFKLLIISLFSSISLMVFYIIGIAKGGVDYARIEVVFGFYFYCIISISLCLIIIINKQPKVFLIIPLVLAIFFADIFRVNTRFSGGRYTDTTPQQKYELVDSWITQIKEADKNRESEVVVRYLQGINIWFDSSSMSTTLYLHNIISRPIKIIFEEVQNENIILPGVK